MWLPVILTMIFVAAGLVLAALLMWAAWRRRDLIVSASEPQTEFGPAETNRWLRGLRIVFLMLILTVLGFHSYWVFRADANRDGPFSKAKRLDARNLRLSESGLKGWVFDRSGKLENALIRYRSDAGVITREYPLGAGEVHRTGYYDVVGGAGG